jgi:hypothetical protein
MKAVDVEQYSLLPKIMVIIINIIPTGEEI